ncbi:spindle pole body formation-associated protein-domain-containing protein [Xylaria venustula]|nr:spindle pole body formation-associated protein-domain-containing protein [Xylaria venustula]
MLGWALKKGFQGATGLRDAPEGGEDTTQFDAPDTPAPVFAARAIKNAIWGQSAATDDRPAATKMQPTEPERVEPTQTTTSTTTTTIKDFPEDNRSPTKLNSILLTPGTGTSRRKRVSFGRDVKAGNNVDTSPFASSSTRNGQSRRKTTLQQALENSRPAKSKEPEPQPEAPDDGEDTEEEWEWDDDENMCCNHDVTVDLNEPHSESGKYWKAEWSRYREEARSDIEQLVKYKANARSFAAKKDMEASELSQKLKEEHAKVAEMEKKMADMTAKLAVTRKHGTDKDSVALTNDLASQTSMIAEYRKRIKDLETRLAEASSKSNSNRSGHQRINTSPRTEQSLLEISRELRKARSELRQMDGLRDEVKRLKSNLAMSRERVAELEIQASAGEATESSRVGKLERQLREAKEESRHKDSEIRKLKREYETLKRDAKSRTAEAMQVLQAKNTKIKELGGKLEEMEADHASNQPKGLDAAMATHNKITRDLRSGIESLGKSTKYEKARPVTQRKRAASVEDITLNMTQRSLLKERDDRLPHDFRQQKPYENDLLADYTVDIPTIELHSKDIPGIRHGAEKLNEDDLIMEDVDALATRRATRGVERRSLLDKYGATSDVLSDRVNESSRRQSRRNQQSDIDNVLSRDRDQKIASQRTAGERTASLAEDKATMHGALDQPIRQSRIVPRTTRPVSPGGDAPAIDLVRDQFTRLGGPSTDRSVLGNTSRCTLPAERQAAARARIEQRRMERHRTSGRVLDKENVRP